MHIFAGLALLLMLVLSGGASAQGYRPSEAAGKMTVPDGLVVKLFASEPQVRQPILVKCDERGRLWTIQYLQYPNPAGLKRIKVDRWSRTVYDRVPEPPPKGPKGADRITICEDTNGDGKADRFKDFVGGLNLCTGLALGHGGVFVLQAPYLLFYRDRNRDDVPDGDPEVLLTGFGMEDAQSLVNHLTWGPDGWLHGVTGSTSTNHVRGIEFQQGVWRYHPLKKKFELFCEGGGNLFGLTFDADGNLIYSSNGSTLAFHAVQGGSCWKVFGKHGPLHNPYAYGWFDHIKYRGPARGPTPGGTIYMGDTFPPQFRGAFLCCDFLDHTVSWWRLKPRGSTFEADFGGRLLDSRDTWFCAPDLCTGPDGSVFVCDFHDRRSAHPDPDAEWDRSNGRVYKIEAKGTKPLKGLDLGRLSSKELVALLRHPSGWHRDQARLLLAARRDNTVWPELSELAVQEKDGRLALQGLWALSVSGGLDDDLAVRLLRHPYEYVRSWTVRLLGDECKVTREVAARLAERAAHDGSVVVRSQLAATARRLPANDGLPIIEAILRRDIDAADPHVPWLIWWALADHAMNDRERMLAFFGSAEARRSGVVRANLPRLMRRYAADGTRGGYDACCRLPDRTSSAMLAALEQGLSERGAILGGMGMGDLFKGSAGGHSDSRTTARKYEALSESLTGLIRECWQEQRSEPLRLRLAIRAGIEPATVHLLGLLADSQTATATRVALLNILEELGQASCVPAVLPLVEPAHPAEVQLAALGVLARFVTPDVTAAVLRHYGRMTTTVRSKSRDVLLGRKESARTLLAHIEVKQIPAADVPLDQVRRIALHNDAALDRLVRKHWGNIAPGTPEEKLAVMRRLSNDLRAGSGDRARGKELYKLHCANCHRLFGEGGAIGPDLTTFARGDREALLASLVDPSAVIKREYLSYVVTTKRGLVLTGLIAEQDGGSVTLVDAMNNKTKIRREEIEEIRESPTSLMPERLAENLTSQQLRDLFSYLQGSKP